MRGSGRPGRSLILLAGAVLGDTYLQKHLVKLSFFNFFCILAKTYRLFCSQDLLETPGCPGCPWVPPGCLLGASLVPPWCLLGASWVSPRCSLGAQMSRRCLSDASQSVQFNSIQFNSIQFNSIQFNSIQIKSSQIKSIQFQSNQIKSTNSIQILYCN